MRLPFYAIQGLAALLLLAGVAGASPIVWTLSDVTLSDGGTANGMFTFDADAGTACGSFSPCGTYSNVDITSTNGSSLTGATYSFVCGEDVVSCTGVSPDSTEVLFLTSNAGDLSGESAIAFFFTGVGVFPPAGLTDAGGVIDISGDNASAGTVQEAACADAACTVPADPARSSIAGSVYAVPEPKSWFLLGGGLGMVALVRRQRKPRRATEGSMCG